VYSSVNGVLFDKSQTTLLAYPEGIGPSFTIAYGVTGIGPSAFESSSRLVSINLPNSLVSIGDSAFLGCSSLLSVAIPPGITNIPVNAFGDCSSLTNVTIPDTLTTISDGAFQSDGNLSSLTIPGSVTSIGEDAFFDCGFHSLTIPDSVTNIGLDAFYWCFGLSAVYFEGNAPASSNAFYAVPATAYYLPGTTGWDVFATNSGIATAPWQPQIQSNDGSFGVLSNQFGFNVTWASGQTVVVDTCTNLANPVWQPFQTNVLAGGSAYFGDPQWTNWPGRFYRVRSP
jgi:hypothetical protein